MTVTADPAVGGTVTGAGEIENGTSHVVTATANEGYAFVNWTVEGEEVSNEATYTFIVNEDVDLVAHFELVPPTMFNVTVTANPTEGGTVTGEGEYEEGTEATVTAEPAEGYLFVNWTVDGEAVSDAAEYTFEVTEDVALVANFELIPPMIYNVSVTANPTEGGTVTGAGAYEEGTEVTVTAVAAEGYEFINWTVDGEEVSNEAEYTFEVVANTSLVANFELIPVTLYNITVLEAQYGALIAPTQAEAGAMITVEAEPYPFYELKTLCYYTTDPEETTPIDLTTMQFEMPEADVTIVGTFGMMENILGDVNGDGKVNVLDVYAIYRWIAGKNPQPFDEEMADFNGDGEINAVDAQLLNAAILGLRGECENATATYQIIDGQLFIESPVGIAGYEFHLSAEATMADMPGFSTMSGWKNGEFVIVVFSLSNEKEAGLYPVLNVTETGVNHVVLATLQGCSVNAEMGILGVETFNENNYSVYPVPAQTEVTVAGPQISMVEVFNAMGQRVMVVSNVNADSCTVNVSDLSMGTYMFRISTANGIAVKNVVVVR